MLGVVMALTTRRRHCSITANAEANLIKVEGELRTRLGDDADICEAVDAAVARLRASSAEAKRQLTDEDHRQNYAKLVVLTSLPPPALYTPVVTALLETMAGNISSGYVVTKASEQDKLRQQMAVVEIALQIMPHSRWTLDSTDFVESQLAMARSNQAAQQAQVEVQVASLWAVYASVRPGVSGYHGGALDSACVQLSLTESVGDPR